jgi:hypothetical protein
MPARRQTTRTFVAQAMASAVSCGLVNLAFLPAKSVSTTPRAVAQALQTKIGIWCSTIFAIARLSGGQPTGVMFAATTVRISTVASPASSIRTSCPASCRAAPQANGKLARVGFSEPQSPTSRKRCFGSFAASADGATAAEANNAVHKCWDISRRVGMTGLYHGSASVRSGCER